VKGGSNGRRGAGGALAAAVALHRAGRVAEAERLYRGVLADDPGNAEALHLLGVVALQRGRPEEAVERIGQAAKRRKKDPQVQNNLGEAYRALGRMEEAADCYKRAIALDARDPAPHNNLGNVLAAAGKAAEAAASYRRALKITPDDPEVLTNLGDALREAGKAEEAVKQFEHALAVAPGFVEAHVSLGRALKDLNRLAAAEAACRRAVTLAPNHAGALGALGTVLAARGDLAGAVASYRRAVAVAPDDAAALTNLGNAVQEMGEFAEAIACHRRAVALDPDNAAAHHNLGNALLLESELAEGWRENEWRWRVEDMEKQRAFPQAPWQGEPLKGKTILVAAEQGVGDEILFAGMVPDLMEAGARVVLECGARLVPLFQRSFKGVACVAKKDPPAAATQSPDIDYQVAAGSLGRWLRPDFASFPGRPSYLVVDAKRRDALRAKYRRGGELVVGIAWVSKNPRFGHQKSMKLAELAPLATVPGVTLVDLQYGDTAAERQAFEMATGTTLLHDDAVDQMASLDDFAAQVAAMDLVVSVSNTTVHMAGALGVPTWVMPHLVPLRVWLLGRADSPWYPSVRLFRQTQAGEWADVIDRVAQELGDLVARPRPSAP